MFGPITNGDQPVIGGIGYPCTSLMYFGFRDPGSWVGVTSFRADPSLIALVQEILAQGGSLAFGLQSIFTILMGVAYYDQLQQFDGVGNVAQSGFCSCHSTTFVQRFHCSCIGGYCSLIAFGRYNVAILSSDGGLVAGECMAGFCCPASRR